nr:MAG TPA: hypothetical protein [Caudoviricetes sp.]
MLKFWYASHSCIARRMTDINATLNPPSCGFFVP